MKKKSPRTKFIESADIKKLAGHSWDAMQLASTHDPDLLMRIEIIERQLQRLGAPQYRRVK